MYRTIKFYETLFSSLLISFGDIKPLSPNSNQHEISPCNINAYSTIEVMRIKDMITKGEFSSHFINFSTLLL